MKSEETLLERMRSRGIRLTKQRRVLAELLDEAEEHLDAEQIFRDARRRDPQIHRATVYRTLKKLKSIGLVDELDLMRTSGDRHFYEVRPSSFHIHLVCTKCGNVQEPEGPFWADLEQRVRRETEFQADVVRMEMGGLCARCRTKRGPDETG